MDVYSHQNCFQLKKMINPKLKIKLYWYTISITYIVIYWSKYKTQNTELIVEFMPKHIIDWT